MITLDTIASTRSELARWRDQGASIGLVPTMGYLHDGHVSLMARSVAENDVTVATIFVNPLQFAAGEDLSTYPHDLQGDSAKCVETGVDLLFTPSNEEMYPAPVRTTISLDVARGFMESASRPTHFDGVATVVQKLFNIMGPCTAYFGEKDFQQLAVVQQMVFDLSIPVRIIGCPIIREPDGVAMSSRNAYLTPAERAQAPVLNRALRRGVALIDGGETSAEVIRTAMSDEIRTADLARLDYVEVVDPQSLEALDRVSGEVRLLVAAQLGTPRLLDNCAAVSPVD